MLESRILSKSIAYGILRALLIIGGVLGLLLFVFKIQAVIFYIGAAAVISLIGRPIVNVLKDKLRFNNTLAVIVTLLFLMLIIMGIVLMIVPVLLEQVENIGKIDLAVVRSNLEVLNVEIRDYFGFKRVDLFQQIKNLDYVRNFDLEIIPDILNNILGTLSEIFIALFSILFIAFFLLKDSRLMLEGVMVFASKNTEGQFLRSFNKIKNLLTRYFVGLVFQFTIIFILYSILLLSLGLNNAIIIAFFCAMLNLIPYLGPVIGYFLMSTFIISDFLGYEFQQVIFPKLIIMTIGYALIQLLDNLVNQPLIFGKSVKSHPLEIFIVIIIAGILFGVLGLVLAVPTYTAIKVISQEFLSEYKIVQKLTQNL